VRYLKGRRKLEWHYDYQGVPKKVTYETDSDWAEDETARKSSSSVYGLFGAHLLDMQVASQPVVARSNGEAEFYAIGRGAASAIMMTQVSNDSCAGRALASRIGSGKVRHLHIRDLWTQERQRSGELELGRRSTSR